MSRDLVNTISELVPDPHMSKFPNSHIEYNFDVSPFPRLTQFYGQDWVYSDEDEEPLRLTKDHKRSTRLRFIRGTEFPSLQEVAEFIAPLNGNAARRATVYDPFDYHLRAALYYSSEAEHWFSLDTNPRHRFLPPSVELRDVALKDTPNALKGMRCLQMYSKDTIPLRTIASGTRIPAGPQHGRAIVLAHFGSIADLHYVLCLHGNRNVFVLEVPGMQMVRDWPRWEDIVGEYLSSDYHKIFFQTRTVFQRTLGVFCHYSTLEYHAEQEATLRQLEEANAISNRWYNVWGWVRRHICRPGLHNDEFEVGAENSHVSVD